MFSQGYGKSSMGKYRNPNEDAYLIDDDLGLYVVSDGIGGEACGEKASAITVSAAHEYIGNHREILEAVLSGKQPVEQALSIAQEALLQACSEIHNTARSAPDFARMGSMATLVLMLGKKAVMAHVGNTRLYLYRKGFLHQLSQDHTVAAEFGLRGIIPQEETHNHVYRHVLTRSLGKHPTVLVDTLLFDLLSQDRLLLCSNGMSANIKESDDLASLLKGEFNSIADSLLELAGSRSGSDDMTVVVARPSRDAFSKLKSSVSYQPIDEYFELLSSVQIFEELTFRQLQRIINLSQIEFHESGDILIEEGHQCPGMLVVLDGKVTVQSHGKEIGILNPGSSTQELSLVNDRVSYATYTTLEPSRILLLERDKFTQFTRQFPRIGLTVLGRLSETLAKGIETNKEGKLYITDAGIGMLNI